MSKIKLHDVAREAGVSVATVDRVLNQRSGVRANTIARVEEAVRTLNYQPDRLAARLARAREYRFCFVLPVGSNTFMGNLCDEIVAHAERMAGERVTITIEHTDVFDAGALAKTLDSLSDQFDGVATVALDHPLVREAIDSLADRGVVVVTLVSDAPRSRRAHFVGIDNVAAGRTAASLLGRFVGQRRGKVGLIAGSLALRDHVERQLGFEQVISQEFPDLQVLPVREGQDNFERVEPMSRELIAETADLVGLYNVGGGNRGVVAALEAAGRSDVVFICHELTVFSRKALIRGITDAIINQDPGHEVRSATRILLALTDGMPIVPGQERIRIDIFIRDNLP